MALEISVLISLFNHEHYIADALGSALAQSLPPTEIIVLDDASTDGSLNAARSVANPIIRVLDEELNLGGPNTVKALQACRGDLVAVLNSDDMWAPEKLQLQHDCLATSPETGAVFTHVRIIDESGDCWNQDAHPFQQVFATKNRSRHEWLRHFFLVGNPFCASSALIRKKCFDHLGPFDARFIQLQDMEMWIRVAIAGYELQVIERPLTYYRVMRDGRNMSTGYSGARATNSFEYAKILRNYWQLASLNELLKIFPEIDVSKKADDSLVLFYLARFAAQLPGLHHRLFALETMSKWGGDYDAMRLAWECHGFDFRAYQNFFANGPFRKILRYDLRYQLNNLALRLLPNSAYQAVKAKLRRR